jgi:putative transposase
LQYVPRVLAADKLGGHGVTERELLPDVEHRKSRYLSSRVENSHRPTRQREQLMQRFKSPYQRSAAFKTWAEETSARKAA